VGVVRERDRNLLVGTVRGREREMFLRVQLEKERGKCVSGYSY